MGFREYISKVVVFTNKVKSRNWKLLLYPDNEYHVNILNYIRKEYSYLCVYHNKDLKDVETGEVKKAHYHVYIVFGGPRWNTSIVDEICSVLGFDVSCLANFIRPVPNESRFLRYLIHKDSPAKFQYDPSNVEGTPDLLERFNDSIYGDTEIVNDSIFLANYIIDNNICDVMSFHIYALSNGYIKAYDRYKSVYMVAINANKNDRVKALKKVLDELGVIV